MSPSRSHVALSVFLAWLVPGLGHAHLGRRRRGLAYFAIIATAFGVGLLLNGRLAFVVPGQPLTVLATLTVSATGILNIGARLLHLGLGDIRSASFEAGSTYLLSAGLMNLLLVLDVVEIARGSKP